MSKYRSNTSIIFASMIVGSLIGLPGCVTESEMDEIDTSQYKLYSDECQDTANCGVNSAQINGYAISELDLAGTPSIPGHPNSAGVEYLALMSPGNELYTLSVENGGLVATSPDGVVLSGNQLVNFRLILRAAGVVFPLYITSHKYASTWTQPFKPRIPVYGLAYPGNLGFGIPLTRRPTESLQSVCPGHTASDTTAVVFAGEVYDVNLRTVIDSSTPQFPNIEHWMSIACTGSAAAKMKFLNYGPQANFDGMGKSATARQRQATLKMITADYCGFGYSFTETGTPIYWQNPYDSAENIQTPDTVEAVWSDTGALCINDGQLRLHTYADVQAICGPATPPPCPADLTIFPSWEWQTSNVLAP